MKPLSVLNVLLIGIGAILIYAAIKDLSPKDVVGMAMGNKPKPTVQTNSFNAAPPTTGANSPTYNV